KFSGHIFCCSHGVVKRLLFLFLFLFPACRVFSQSLKVEPCAVSGDTVPFMFFSNQKSAVVLKYKEVRVKCTNAGSVKIVLKGAKENYGTDTLWMNAGGSVKMPPELGPHQAGVIVITYDPGGPPQRRYRIITSDKNSDALILINDDYSKPVSFSSGPVTGMATAIAGRLSPADLVVRNKSDEDIFVDSIRTAPGDISVTTAFPLIIFPGSTADVPVTLDLRNRLGGYFASGCAVFFHLRTKTEDESNYMFSYALVPDIGFLPNGLSLFPDNVFNAGTVKRGDDAIAGFVLVNKGDRTLHTGLMPDKQITANKDSVLPGDTFHLRIALNTAYLDSGSSVSRIDVAFPPYYMPVPFFIKANLLSPKPGSADALVCLSSLDFDTVCSDTAGVIKRIVLLKNESKLTPLTITRVTTSDGGSMADLEGNNPVLNPGDTARVIIYFDAANRTGPYSKTLSVQWDNGSLGNSPGCFLQAFKGCVIKGCR
ncbi:MAG TPA: hypothetical protein VFU15_15900, partial [Bacteroidia bacterium]|nr:hypothetical protein [Bacteroidia bacterium]